MLSPRPTKHPHRRHKKAWSPVTRDPRFSRHTPDRLLARIASQQCIRTVSGDAFSWACRIIHAKARKTPVYDPKRKKMIGLLQLKAENAEKPFEKTLHNTKMVTPSSAPPVARQETVQLMQVLRSARDGDCSERVMCSPAKAPCM